MQAGKVEAMSKQPHGSLSFRLETPSNQQLIGNTSGGEIASTYLNIMKAVVENSRHSLYKS
jgi:hypothetical protein